MDIWKSNGPTFTDGVLEFGAPSPIQAQRIVNLLNSQQAMFETLAALLESQDAKAWERARQVLVNAPNDAREK